MFRKPVMLDSFRDSANLLGDLTCGVALAECVEDACVVDTNNQ